MNMRNLYYKVSLYIRFILKAIATLYSITEKSPAGIYFLMYHSIGESVDLEIDIDKDTFVSQIRYLKKVGNVISIDEAVFLLSQGKELRERYFVITFDDGYKNFMTNVLPIIEEHETPTLIYINTKYIEDNEALPIAKKVGFNGKIDALSWDEIRDLSRMQLITIGCHCHQHRELTTISDEEIVKDFKNSIRLFHDHVSLEPSHLCYPRGVYNERVKQIARSHFNSAVKTTNSGKPVTKIIGNFEIPRIPILKTDGLFWFKLRIDGKLYADAAVIKYLSKVMLR